VLSWWVLKMLNIFFCYLKPTSLTKFLPKYKHAMGNETGSSLGWSDKTVAKLIRKKKLMHKQVE
jgi:hypothetical protein